MNRWIPVRILLGIAAAVAGYLAWISLSGNAAAGCGPESGCREVLGSRWAYWLGFPVSILAAPIYLALLAATFQAAPSQSGSPPHPSRTRAAWLLLISGGCLVAGAAVWFTLLQLFVLKAFCPFCMTAHGAAFLAAWLIWRRAPGTGKGATRKSGLPQVHLKAGTRPACAFAALALLSILATGQVLQKEPPVQWTRMDHGSNRAPAVVAPKETPGAPEPRTLAASPTVEPDPMPVPPASETPDNADAPVTSAPTDPEARSTNPVDLFDGAIVLDPGELPVLGNAAAPHPIVSLFDYTCHHCRETHHSIRAALEAFGDQICFISLPVPLDAKCNRVVRQTHDVHRNACWFASLGLAVFRIAPEKSEAFDEWMFRTHEAPKVADARRYAEELVDATALAREMRGAWVRERINQAVDIFEGNYRTYRKGTLPQLIIGDQLASGPITNADDLISTIRRTFGIEPVHAGL